MDRVAFIAECRECGFEINAKWLRGKKGLQKSNFHRFDVVLVEHYLRRRGGVAAVIPKMVQIAELLEEKFIEIMEDHKYEAREAGYKKEQERNALFTLLQAQYGAELMKISVTVEELEDTDHIIRVQIRHYDGYWKSRWLFVKFSTEDRKTLEKNAMGHQRYAHTLYDLGGCIGKLLSLRTGKAVLPLVAQSRSGFDELRPFSFCACGRKMPDWGRKPRKHCGRPECKKQYEKLRKRKQRQRVGE